MSVPVLSLVMSPVKAAVLLLPLFVISDAVGVWLYRKQFSLVNLKILIPAHNGQALPTACEVGYETQFRPVSAVRRMDVNAWGINV